MPKASNGYDGNGCLNLSGTCFSFKTMKLNLLGANKSSLHRMMLRDKHVNFLTPTISLTNPLWPLFPNFAPTIIEAHLPPKLDSYSKWIRQKCYQFFINEKLKKTSYFFTCILPNYVPHEISKEFWKIVILKIWQQVFFWDAKTHFGEIPLKRWLLRNDIFHFHQYCPYNSYCP